MLKRIASIGLLLLLVAPLPARALDVYGNGSSGQFGQNAGQQPLGDVIFNMDSAQNPVTAAKGIDLLLPSTQWALWDKNVVTATVTGNATGLAKMSSPVALTYSTDLKTLHIPVRSDWAVGDQITISGLQVRIYDRASGPQPLNIDLNGDGMADYTSRVIIRIDSTNPQTDRTPPYPATNFKAAVLQNPWQVVLTWVAPLDYDWIGSDLERKVGDKPVESLFSGGGDVTFTDMAVHEGDSITYSLYSVDRRGNRSEAVTVSVQPSTGGDSSPPTAVQNDMGAAEHDLLTRLFTSFRVRYLIKCLPAGHAVSSATASAGPSAGDSACLWSKIDLVYAQTRLNRSDVPLSLNADDRRFMTLRLPLGQSRYAAQCPATAGPSASTPPAYCGSLNEALGRAQYLLNP